jgi:hypothetical protein
MLGVVWIKKKGLPSRLVLGLVVAVASAAVALLSLEGIVRLAGLGSDQLLRDDGVLGVRFIESKVGLSQGSCYRATVTISPQGWRSPPFSLAKSEGVFRILVLGDSFMAGMQVGDDDTFSRVLERRLNVAGLGRRVEVITFGVPSWGTDQQYLALRQYGLKLNPDLVLVAFYAQNDVAETDLELRSATSTYPKPYFDLHAGRLIELPFVDSTPIPIRIGRRLAASFRLYPMTRDALLTIPIAHQLLYRFGIVGVVPVESRSSGASDAPVWKWPDRWRRQIGVFERRPFANWSRAWEISEALLHRMNAEAVSTGAEFLLMGVASPIEVMPLSIHSVLVGDMDDFDAELAGTKLVEIGARRGFDVASMVPGFRARIGASESEFGNLFLSCDGHWTVEGHQLAGELAARELAPRIIRALRPGGASSDDVSGEHEVTHISEISRN